MHAFKSADKESHDRSSGDHIIPLHPARCLYAGPPGSGKTSVVKNIVGLMQRKTPWDSITVLHVSDDTLEYDMFSDHPNFRFCVISDEIPHPSSFDRNLRNLLIMDELPWGRLSRSQMDQLYTLFTFASTHNSVTIMCQVQRAFTIPINIRDTFTYVSLWNSAIATTRQHYSRMIGINLSPIFDALPDQKHDFVTIDFSNDGPKVRKNFIKPIYRNK